MKRVDLVYETLREWERNGKRWVSAEELACALGLDRANVSRDLNRLWREGKVQKQTGRPVRFALACGPKAMTRLDRLAKQQPSLAAAVEQGKAAVLYPPKGLPMLIVGETGTGKSMFAELLHEFAVAAGRFPPGAPFVTFNCADYTNNPQLLLGQLFGIRKGAYTGANEQKGLIEKADGGILFLDEVHRLPAEGQEMLFTFIDRGIYRRLGETDVERTANVLLICATTEDPESNLLKTFRRRIPMHILLPPLEKRTLDERFRLVMQFFQEEAVRLGKEIDVSANAMRAFLFYPCPNNVGQLKADVQLVCAKAYADYVTGKKQAVRIHRADLPFQVQSGLLLEKKHPQAASYSLPRRWYAFPPHGGEADVESGPAAESESVYGAIERKYGELKERGIAGDELDLLLEMDIKHYFSQYMKGVDRRIRDRRDLEKMVAPDVLELTEAMVVYAEKKLGRRLAEKVMYALAMHIQTAINRLRAGTIVSHPKLNEVRAAYKQEFAVALDCLQLMEERTNIDFPIDEAGFLTMFFAFHEEQAEEREERVAIVVVMHGNGVASAMADVVNQLLAAACVHAVDMPLDADPKRIYEQVKAVLQPVASKKGALLLVDMGSLVSFSNFLEKELAVPVRVISAASTPHVLEAARKAMLGYALQEIYEEVKAAAPFYIRGPFWEEEAAEQDMLAIVTACFTGKGSALALKHILETYLQLDERMWRIIPIQMADAEEARQTLSNVAKHFRIVCIVSHLCLDERIPHFSLEDVLSLRAMKEIQALADVEEIHMHMARELTNHLRHLAPARAIPAIRAALAAIGRELDLEADGRDLVGLVFHLCCLLDRLLSGERTSGDRGAAKACGHEDEDGALYRVVKEGLFPLEQQYGVCIDEDELCHIVHFFRSLQGKRDG
ncbi:sigma-54-dependent transcriptional regulator [Geobacillus stearothermophilus]|nr:sigma-54-dependent transcriptional regulator [Geobacillus stearothermophilus]